MSLPTPPPESTRRLLPAELDPLAPQHEDELIRRLLEDGESEDLRWLVGRVGEARLQTFLRQRGGKHLSRRSRSFWALVLDTQTGAPHPLAEELWLL
ncbi:MAG: hypothetical protein AAGD01_01825 [Acidobacteriota bacterium]